MGKVESSYLVKRGSDNFATISSLFHGVRILKVEGFSEKGKPINIYTEQWVNSQTEDYMVTSLDENGTPYIVRENVNLVVTFVVSDRYGATNVRTTHDAFVAYMTDGELYLKSEYVQRTMRCVCLDNYKPTVIRLRRPSGQNFMMGSITLHTLDERAGQGDGYAPNPYAQGI